MTDYLLPLADREPLFWVLSHGRAAFTAGRARDAARLEVADRLFVYTTRGCFRNPVRDRGQVVGLALVTAPASRLREPISFRDIDYVLAVDFNLMLLAPARGGVDLGSLAGQLEILRGSGHWGPRLRRALVPLETSDAGRLEDELGRLSIPREDALKTYETLLDPLASRHARR